MFNPSNYANSRPGGFGVLEIVAPDLPELPEPQIRYFVPLRETEARGQVVGPLAHIELIQTFAFSRQVLDQTIEALYRFPLPGDAAVNGVIVRFGDVEISATLKARAEAEADYAQAKSEGRQAALLTRETADVFTLQVAGIKPDDEVRIQTTYTQLARDEGKRWTLRIPLTTAPRYVRADEVESPHSQGQPLAVLRDPGHRFRLHLAFPDATEVTSPTHPLVVSDFDDGRLVELAEGAVIPDRDCVLQWQMALGDEGAALQLFQFDDEPDGFTYFLAQTRPPALRPNTTGHRREIVLLVDHSGSMGGAKWEAADWAVARFLRSLHPQDAFALAVFHNHTTWYGDGRLHSAEDSVVAEAIAWLKAHKDSGGTELGVALEQALAIPRTSGAASRHVLFLTDAEVTDAGRILRLAAKEATRDDRRRISVLCIDAAPNAFLAQELAERGGGVARFLTSNPDDEDITTALDQVLSYWSEPVLIGASLAVNRPDVAAAGRAVTSEARRGLVDLGDLAAGQTQWVCGRAPLAGTPLAVSLVLASGKVVATADAAETGQEMGAIKSLFGARQVNGLEYLMTAGYSQATLRSELERLGYDLGAEQKDTATAVYAENALRDAEKLVNRLLVRASLEYGVPSSATAFVAVRTEKGERVAGTVAVANALPAGWSEEFVSSGLVARSRRRSMPGVQPFAAPQGPALSMMHDPSLAMPAAYPGAAFDIPAPDKGGSNWVAIFEGKVRDANQILFDSRQEDRLLGGPGKLTGLRVAGVGAIDPADAGAITLLLYIGDLATPRARVTLADLLPAERPLNLRRRAGETILLVAEQSAGTSITRPIPVKVALCFTP